MTQIRDIRVKELPDCCQKTANALVIDYNQLCIKTKTCFAGWKKERECRLTGSTCYGLFTYCSNKKPDWKKKCRSHLAPQTFTVEYTEYGKAMEKEARVLFQLLTNKQVVETGLVVSKLNPRLAYSSDGVIFKDKKSTESLEIKCPYSGKKENIKDMMEVQVGKTVIIESDKTYSLKKKHKYYGQVQMGMAVMNLPKTSFAFYASFDKSMFVLEVPFDPIFVVKMLSTLKTMFFNIMLHEICLFSEKPEQVAIDCNNNE